MTLIPIDRIVPNPEQPRKTFDPVELQALANSIRETGLVQPITVEEAGDHYILHDGERRLRAHRMTGLSEIEAVIVPPLNGSGSQSRLVRALVANLQRSDLDPIEEAEGFAALRDQGLSNVEISRKLGVNTVRITDRLALLSYEPEIQDLIRSRSFSKARAVRDALMEITDPQARIRLARSAAERGSSARTIIAAAQRVAASGMPKKAEPHAPPAISHALARSKSTLPPARWDAIAQAGGVPPWPLLVEAARATCRGCLLRPSASEETCKTCPLPESIVLMVAKVKNSNG